MNFVTVRRKGDPNKEDGGYQRAAGMFYGIAFTIKMSYRGTAANQGYFPLYDFPTGRVLAAGGTDGVDYARKGDLQWISAVQ